MWIFFSSRFLLLNQDRKPLEAHEYCMIKHAKFATHGLHRCISLHPRVDKKFFVLFIERPDTVVVAILISDWFRQ